jgi:hypothetical protein
LFGHSHRKTTERGDLRCSANPGRQASGYSAWAPEVSDRAIRDRNRVTEFARLANPQSLSLFLERASYYSFIAAGEPKMADRDLAKEHLPLAGTRHASLVLPFDESLPSTRRRVLLASLLAALPLDFSSKRAEAINPFETQMDVSAITTDHVVAVLKPMWARIPETAERLRGADRSSVGLSQGERVENRGKPSSLARTSHVNPTETATSDTWAPCRSSASAHTCVDHAASAVSFHRRSRFGILYSYGCKIERGFRRAMEGDHTKATSPSKDRPFVFEGNKPGHPLSTMAMAMQLRRLGRTNIPVHGFRSSFRDWVWEETEFPHELAEQALAHTVQNKADAAYRRGDALERRRVMMNEWADFCNQETE